MNIGTTEIILILALLMILIVPIAIIVLVIYISRKRQNNLKKCPFCAEMIQPEAAICRYCGRDLA